MSDPEPILTEQGWDRIVVLPAGGAVRHRILFYADGTVRFEHRCHRPHITVTCAPRLRLDGGHRIVQDDPLTVEPSILCPDCGTHGFVRDGAWVAA